MNDFQLKILNGLEPEPMPYRPHRPKPKKLSWADKLLHKAGYADSKAVKAEMQRINEATRYHAKRNEGK